jgi:hypothetical protein
MGPAAACPVSAGRMGIVAIASDQSDMADNDMDAGINDRKIKIAFA